MMELRLLAIAQIELDEAVDFYDSESPGLGAEFLLEVLRAMERIRGFPNAWHPFSENTRRCQTRRFPYGIIYQVLSEEILVIAVANLHRNPDYWKDRLVE